MKKCKVLSSILVFIHLKLIKESCTTSGVYLEPYQTSMMKLLAILFSQKRSIIDIWQGSKYVSAALLLNIFSISLLGHLNEYKNILFSSESVQLLSSCEVNQKYKIFHWFPNYLFYINHGNTKFWYVYTKEMRKNPLWKTSRWNARLVYTINISSNKNNNKSQARITKALEKFPLSEKKIIYYVTKTFLLRTLNDIASFDFFQILLILTIHQYTKV